jgi:formylglycine-generating enzyme required for sulfatase activity
MRTWQIVVLVAGLLVAGGALRADGTAPPPKAWEVAGTQAGQEITGPDGGTMVWVPAGSFLMGSPDQEGYGNEHPQHQVRITQGFWLGKCTVTNAQYARYCQATGVALPEDSNQGDNHPVVNMTWFDAKAYCVHYGLSLPTEAQWEYAARGPEGRKYPWGDQWDKDKCCNVGNQGPKGQTFPVGSFPAGASWCGVLDMAGNVWQWCQDWYDDKYYANSPTQDPPGPDTPGADTGDWRVLRGGSWLNGAGLCRSAYRRFNDPEHRLDLGGGFRCSRTP